MQKIAWSRISLWVALIVLFVVFYNFFSAPNAGPDGEALPPPWWLGPMPFAFIVGAIVLAMLSVLFIRLRRMGALNVEGLQLVQEGRYVDALAVFERARRVQPRNMVLAYNVATAQLKLWRLAETVTELEKVQAGPLPGLKALAPPMIALAHALQGQAQLAHRCLEQAKSLQNEGAPEAVLASAVLACRAQNWPEARVLLSRRELRTLGGPPRGLSDALRAWTAHQLDGVRAPIDRISLFGEAGPQQLRQAWPELIAFVDGAPAV